MVDLPSRRLKRTELVRIIDEATEGLTPSTRAKLLAVAESTEAVSVGWFHCDGVGCPASQASRRNQTFQGAFDRAMCARFGLRFDDEAEWPALPVEPFVVEVIA